MATVTQAEDIYTLIENSRFAVTDHRKARSEGGKKSTRTREAIMPFCFVSVIDRRCVSSGADDSVSQTGIKFRMREQRLS